MSEMFEWDPVSFVTAGALGEPGSRTFYIQAEHEGQRAAFVVEKGQVRTLAQLAQELLARVDLDVKPDDLDVSAQALREPVVGWWRVGAIGIGASDDGARYLLELTEAVPQAPGAEPADVEELLEDDEARRARLWLDADQLVGLAAHAAYSVEAGARQTCQLCGRPIDPVDGHVCPASNGHGTLTV